MGIAGRMSAFPDRIGWWGVHGLLVAVTVMGWCGCERRLNPVGPTKLRGRIAFHAVYNFIPQIFSIYPDEPDDVRRLTSTRSDDISPRWSPDGTHIAFLSNRNVSPDFFRLYMMNADGSNVTDLFDPLIHPEGDLEFSWAPDGRHIALVNRVSGPRTNRRQLYILDVDTRERRLVASSPPDRFAPDWSPDGTRIVFASSFPRSSTSTLDILSYPELSVETVSMEITTPNFPRWSPDGKSVAFVALSAPQTYQLYIADGADFAVRQVTHLTKGVSSTSPITWSPNGQKILFSARGTNPFDPVSRDLYLINMDGTQLVRLTTDPTDEAAPDWTPHD